MPDLHANRGHKRLGKLTLLCIQYHINVNNDLTSLQYLQSTLAVLDVHILMKTVSHTYVIAVYFC